MLVRAPWISFATVHRYLGSFTCRLGFLLIYYMYCGGLCLILNFSSKHWEPWCKQTPKSCRSYLFISFAYWCQLLFLFFGELMLFSFHLPAYASGARKAKSTSDATHSRASGWLSAPDQWTCGRRGVRGILYTIIWMNSWMDMMILICFLTCNQERTRAAGNSATGGDHHTWGARIHWTCKFINPVF